MTDSPTPGGAGLPEDPGGAPATPPEASPPEAPAVPDSTPLERAAGFGLPASMAGDPPPLEAPAPAPAPDPTPMPEATPGAATPEWGAPPAGWAPGGGGLAAGAAVTPAKRKLPVRLIIVVAVILVFIGVVLFLTKDQKSASDLTVGDCFEVPSASVDINTVKSGPCNQTHTGEIFFISNYPDAAAYPSDSDFEQFAETSCNPVYTTYVGASLDSTPDLTVGFFYPQSDGWSSGDRTVKCYVTRVDGGPITKSLKGSGGSL
ncbi:MAG TPA: septum formation family protein [Candidatus Limnocylindrales bacterium]|jgi:hypothetical protein